MDEATTRLIHAYRTADGPAGCFHKDEYRQCEDDGDLIYQSAIPGLIETWLLSPEAEQRLAAALREIGITPPPHSVNTGHIAARLLLAAMVR